MFHNYGTFFVSKNLTKILVANILIGIFILFSIVMSTLFNKFLHDYHNAHEWAHQHTAMVIGGIIMVSALLVTQITSFMNGSTHADRTPTWCQDNAGFLQIPEEECDILLDFYLATDGDNWNSNNGWFDDPSNICR